MVFEESNWTLTAEHSHSTYSRDQMFELREGLHPETQVKNIAAEVRGYKVDPQAVTGGTNSTVQVSRTANVVKGVENGSPSQEEDCSV